MPVFMLQTLKNRLLLRSVDNRNGSWLHAYLHRKESDLQNAAYWYNRAGQPVCQTSLEDEWQHLATQFLN